MKNFFIYAAIAGLIGVGAVVFSVPTKAAPDKTIIKTIYRMGPTTVYEWKADYRRCILVISDISSHRPALSCTT